MDPSPYRKHHQVNNHLPITTSTLPPSPPTGCRFLGLSRRRGRRRGREERFRTRLQPASAGARTTADSLTGTTPRGGIGERPASESRRLALWFLIFPPYTHTRQLPTPKKYKNERKTFLVTKMRERLLYYSWLAGWMGDMGGKGVLLA